MMFWRMLDGYRTQLCFARFRMPVARSTYRLSKDTQNLFSQIQQIKFVPPFALYPGFFPYAQVAVSSSLRA